jgi:hypothetical protein
MMFDYAFAIVGSWRGNRSGHISTEIVMKRLALLPLLLAICLLFSGSATAAIQIDSVEITDARGNPSTEFGYRDLIIITMNYIRTDGVR